jgi:ribosome assembly protein 4
MDHQDKKAKIDVDQKVQVQFASQEEGGETSSTLHIPITSNIKQLNLILNELLRNDDPLPYSFYINEKEITNQIDELGVGSEDRVTITYIPQAVFRVRTVTRCTSTLTGHGEAVLNCSFSPDGRSLASASGDTTVRIWNLSTETPRHTLKGHTNWVQHVAWSPDCRLLVSGGMDSTLRVWDPEKGVEIGVMRAHKQPITALAFEPFHLNASCNRMASASKDGTVRIWDVVQRKVLFVLSQHTAPITCVRWSGGTILMDFTYTRWCYLFWFSRQIDQDVGSKQWQVNQVT